MPAIETHDLRKVYGNTIALNGISFDVELGEVFGLIGPNGSGKTTTLRILSTLIKPSGGSASIFGHDVARDEEKVKGLISYLPEEAGVYRNLTGYQYLRFIGSLYPSQQQNLDAAIKEAGEISGLGERLKENAGTYSQGMKRRLLISRVMMLRPRVAILDEPTSGLDVIHATHIRQLIRRYAKDFGVTVLMSSHNMLEIEYVCNRIALMDKGRILAIGTPSEIKASHGAANLEEAFIKVISSG